MPEPRELIRRIFDELFAEDYVDHGPMGDMRGRDTGTHTGDALGFPATGKRFETVSANIGRMRDGRASEHWAEQGMFPMLIQLGLIPMSA